MCIRERQRDEVYGEPHVLVSVHVCIKVIIFNVNAHALGIWGGDDAVESNFCRSETGGFSTDIAGVIYKITSNSETRSVDFGLVWSQLTNNAAVGNNSARGDLTVTDEEDGVGTLFSLSDTLCKAA